MNKVDKNLNVFYENYSLYGLAVKIYNCKRDYYNKGTSKLTDEEYDSLERSFIAIHGKHKYDNMIHVGYNKTYHEEYRVRFFLNLKDEKCYKLKIRKGVLCPNLV